VNRPRPVVAALVVGLVATAVAVAADGPRGETIRLNPSDQASARAATLRRSDLGPESGPPWKKVPAKPILSAPVDCPAGADMSRFVVTGAARTRWLGGIIEVDSQTDVFETSRMLRGELQKRVASPHALACLRLSLSGSLAEQGDTLVSLGRISVRHLGAPAFGLRAVTLERGLPDLLLTEAIVIGRSRTVIVVTVNGFVQDEAEILATARNCARIVAGRIQA